MRAALSVAVLSLGLVRASAAQAFNYDEAVNGDLSNDRLAPTALVLASGSNLLKATSVSGDREYFHLTVPAGTQLGALNVISSTSASLSFIAVQSGTTFSYAHFGPGNGTVGTDILDDMGTASGAMDFVPPLASGEYTFWSQETSGTPTTYQLEFVVTTARPASLPRSWVLALGLLLALLGAWGQRRLRRRFGVTVISP